MIRRIGQAWAPITAGPSKFKVQGFNVHGWFSDFGRTYPGLIQNPKSKPKMELKWISIYPKSCNS